MPKHKDDTTIAIGYFWFFFSRLYMVPLKINSSAKGASKPLTKSPTTNAAEYCSAAACLKLSDTLVMPVSSYKRFMPTAAPSTPSTMQAYAEGDCRRACFSFTSRSALPISSFAKNLQMTKPATR